MIRLRGLFCLQVLLVTLSTVVLAQDSPPLRGITYRLSMPRPASHLFFVSVDVDLPSGSTLDSLDFQMPMWSPGRYAVFDFAKNVQEFQASSVTCSPRPNAPSSANCAVNALPFKRLDNQTWRVSTSASQRLTISYKVFGDDLS